MLCVVLSVDIYSDNLFLIGEVYSTWSSFRKKLNMYFSREDTFGKNLARSEQKNCSTRCSFFVKLSVFSFTEGSNNKGCTPYSSFGTQVSFFVIEYSRISKPHFGVKARLVLNPLSKQTASILLFG